MFSNSSTDRSAKPQSSLTLRAKTTLRKAVWTSLVGYSLVVSGCNSTGGLPRSMNANLLPGQVHSRQQQWPGGQATTRLAQQAPARTRGPAQTPVQVTASTAPVIPASHVELQDSRAASNSSSPISAQLVGLRRSVGGNRATAYVEANCSANACGPGNPLESALPGSCECGDSQPTVRGYDASEWVCDGGDLDPATVIKEDWSTAGVGSTDTVMYYETLGGQVCVRPSNRTCVYAPRFGSVRQVVGPGSAENALSPNRLHAPQLVNNVLDRNLAGSLAVKSKVIGQKQVHMLDRLNDQQQGVRVQSVVPPTPVNTILAPQVNQDRTLLEESLGRDWAELLNGRIEVITLINPESIQLLVGEQAVGLVRDTKQPAEVFLYETPDKCSMRLTKTASHQMAASGDRIRFTLRFENMGNQKLGNAVILDSLSPRLSYIEGSQLCSVEAQFTIQPNEVGSDVLRWSLQSPVESQQGGVISFDCLVR